MTFLHPAQRSEDLHDLQRVLMKNFLDPVLKTGRHGRDYFPIVET